MPGLLTHILYRFTREPIKPGEIPAGKSELMMTPFLDTVKYMINNQSPPPDSPHQIVMFPSHYGSYDIYINDRRDRRCSRSINLMINRDPKERNTVSEVRYFSPAQGVIYSQTLEYNQPGELNPLRSKTHTLSVEIDATSYDLAFPIDAEIGPLVDISAPWDCARGISIDTLDPEIQEALKSQIDPCIQAISVDRVFGVPDYSLQHLHFVQ